MKQPTARQLLMIQAALLVGALIFLYGRASTFQFVNYDDDLYIFSEQTRGWASLPLSERLFTPYLGYPVPAPVAIYWSCLQIFGPEGAAQPLHLISLATHILNALLLWRLARTCCASPAAAWAVAFVWAIHPANVEAVCWATALKDLLCATGILIALQSLLASRQLSSLVCLIVGTLLAFASKPSAVILGPILLLALYARRAALSPQQINPILVASILSIIWAPIHVWLSSAAHDALVGERAEMPLWHRVPGTLSAQLEAALVPLNLRVFYILEPPQPRDFILLFVIASLGAAAVLVLYKRNARGVLFALGATALAYAPHSNVIQGGRLIGNAYLYLPLAFGLLTISLALFGARDNEADPETQAPGRGALALLLCLCIASGVISWRQVGTWSNSVMLWNHARQYYPEEPFIHVKLGDALFAGHRYDLAVECYAFAFQHGARLDYFPWRWPVALWRMGAHEQADQLFRWFFSQPLDTTPGGIYAHKNMSRFYGDFCAQTGRACPPLP